MLSRDKTKLYIKKRQIPEWLVLLVIILPFAYGFLFSLLNATALIKYSIDVFWLSLFAIMLLN